MDTGQTQRPFSKYKDLIVWKETKNLVLLTYKITDKFPKSEEFALKNQIRRAVISILSQIAEGWLRNTTKDKLHFLDIALGSLLEVEAQMDVSKDLNYINEKDYSDFDNLRARVSFLLYKYTSKIKENSNL